MNKNQKTAIALIVALAAVLACAGALYPRLTARVEAGRTEVEPVQTEISGAVTLAPQGMDAQATDTQVTDAPTEVAGPVQKNMAADFTVYDDAGETFSLSGFRGKPVVVNFFASWCGPCKIEMPYFEALYQEYGERVSFMMVDLNAFGNDTKENAQKMVAEGGYTFPVYFDTDGEATLAYSIRSMPMTIFVSPTGELKGQKIGAMDEQTLRQTIEAMAEEN